MKKVAFLHYRTGERDGVGLEIEKRAAMAEKLGAQVFFISGYDANKRENAYIIPEMDHMREDVSALRLELFQYGKTPEANIVSQYTTYEAQIMERLEHFFKQHTIDMLFVHNLFSLALNLPASTALLKVLDHVPIPTITVHHDFWFEREKYAHPKYSFIPPILAQLPPIRPFIKEHFVINSLAQTTLKKKQHIEAIRIGDYFDFNKPLPKVDEFTQSLPQDIGIDTKDIVILQATRVVRRKGIENAIRYTKSFNEYIKSHAPFVCNGKQITKNQKAILLLTNFIEADEQTYVEELKTIAKELDVTMIWAQEWFALERKKGQKKTYSFWDGYLFADIVTYPSLLEGFGNQLLEAFYFHKLPVVFEYPVFVSDLKQEGYSYISLGSTVQAVKGLWFVPEEILEHAVIRTVEILSKKNTHQMMLTNNASLAKKFHDESRLRKEFEKFLAFSPSLLQRFLYTCTTLPYSQLLSRKTTTNPTSNN